MGKNRNNGPERATATMTNRLLSAGLRQTKHGVFEGVPFWKVAVADGELSVLCGYHTKGSRIGGALIGIIRSN